MGISSPHYARATCCDRGYGRPSGRPRVSDLATYGKVRLRSSPAVPWDGCPVARPSPQSHHGVSCIMRAKESGPSRSRSVVLFFRLDRPGGAPPFCPCDLSDLVHLLKG